MATCKNCGKPLIPNGGKCIYCGAPQNRQIPVGNEDSLTLANICPNCGRSQPSGARFCNNCGLPMLDNGSPTNSLPLRIEYGNVFCKLTKQTGALGYTGTIEIPSYLEGQKVTAIGERAFWGDSGLTSITIPNTVTHIGDDAFYNCGISEITIPNSVVSIGNHAFDSCYNLTNLVISNSVVSIGNYAFYGCRSLTKIVIPRSVRHIGMYAFRGCNATSIFVPPTVESVHPSAFLDQCNYDKPLLIVIPKRFLSKFNYRNILGEFGICRLSVKDENGIIVNYEDLPETFV